MLRLRPFLLGLLTGVLTSLLLLALTIRFLPHLLVVTSQPTSADAIVVLGGDNDGSRLRTGLKLHDDKYAPHLILVGNSNKAWVATLKKICPDCTLEGRGAILLDGSTDTRTDAQISLAYARARNLRTLLVVTSPYHTRRSQFIFNDIAEGLKDEPAEPRTGSGTNRQTLEKAPVRDSATSGSSPLPVRASVFSDFKVTVISSGGYGTLLPPSGHWWADRKTLETVWLEFGKILYWELTPYLEFQGEGERLRESDRAR